MTQKPTRYEQDTEKTKEVIVSVCDQWPAAAEPCQCLTQKPKTPPPPPKLAKPKEKIK